jgi:hypothetical protein
LHFIIFGIEGMSENADVVAVLLACLLIINASGTETKRKVAKLSIVE